jgi:flagellar capping protein FliD
LWRAALSEARKARPDPSVEQASAIITNFITGFNKLPDFIDTEMREQACDAAHRLMREHLGAALNEESTAELIDEHRDF